MIRGEWISFGDTQIYLPFNIRFGTKTFTMILCDCSSPFPMKKFETNFVKIGPLKKYLPHTNKHKFHHFSLEMLVTNHVRPKRFLILLIEIKIGPSIFPIFKGFLTKGRELRQAGNFDEITEINGSKLSFKCTMFLANNQ